VSAFLVADSTALFEVGRIVMARVGIPKDRWEIAAQLEVLGYRDIDAREQLGCTDVFAAADVIFASFLAGELPFVVDEDPPPPRMAWLLEGLRHYVEGLMLSLPMVLQGATMLLWGIGLWGATGLDGRTSSAIGLGFVTSYIVTSGFSWAIVSRTLYYHYQGEGALARWTALQLWGLAVRITLLLAIPALLFNLVYGLLPWDMVLLALVFYVALAIFWLNWSLIYAVGRGLWLLGVLVLAIGAALAGSRLLGLSPVAANVLGLTIACLLTFAVGFDGLRRWARKGNGNGNGDGVVNPPRLIVLVYSTARVFLYGLLYSLFVFADRLIAWTGMRGRDDFPPYPFWLNAPYELAMDLALVVIVLLAGIVEASSHRFTAKLIPAQKRTRSHDSERFVGELRTLYNRQSVVLAIGGLVALAATAGLVRALREFPDPLLQAGLASDTTMRVVVVAAVSYAIFMFSLRNVLTLMMLMQAGLAARAIGIALVVNVVVGYVVSRSVHFSGAVFGLLAGCICLAVLTHREMRGLLRELDYHYYAGF
jgi:hypothetical protein